MEEVKTLCAHRDERMNAAKERLAYELTKMVHGEEAANTAQSQARAAFGGEGEMPEKVIPAEVDTLIGVLVATGLCKSNGEARRLIEQNGVSVGEEKGTLDTVLPEKEFILHKGKKVHIRVIRK